MHIKRVTPSGEPAIHATIPVATEMGPDNIRRGRRIGYTASQLGTMARSTTPRRKRCAKSIRDGTVSLVTDSIDIPDCEGHERGGVMLRGIDVAADGTLYVVATGCAAIVRIAPDGAIDFPLLQRDESWTATGVAVHEDDVYVLEYWYAEPGNPDTWLPRVRKLQPDGGRDDFSDVIRYSQSINRVHANCSTSLCSVAFSTSSNSSLAFVQKSSHEKRNTGAFG